MEVIHTKARTKDHTKARTKNHTKAQVTTAVTVAAMAAAAAAVLAVADEIENNFAAKKKYTLNITSDFLLNPSALYEAGGFL